MKHLIYIIIILFSLQAKAQVSTENKQFKIDVMTLEKRTKDTLFASIIEVFSGEKRIETATTDFDGRSIFFIKSEDIVHNKIRMKIHGMKCTVHEKEYELTADLNTKIYLEYGVSEYTNPNQLSEMNKKLNIKPKMFECIFVEPTVIIKN